MLVFPSQNLVFLAVPKAASTSIEAVLSERASQELKDADFPKHMPARQFFRRWRKLYSCESAELEGFAVLRDPIDRLKSWYLYRQRPAIAGSPKSTAHVSFDEFVMDHLSASPSPFADVGNQYRFCTDEDGRVLVRHLFSFSKLERLQQFLDDRFGQVATLPHLNASPAGLPQLSGSVLTQLHAARSSEFKLFAEVDVEGYREFPIR